MIKQIKTDISNTYVYPKTSSDAVLMGDGLSLTYVYDNLAQKIEELWERYTRVQVSSLSILGNETITSLQDTSLNISYYPSNAYFKGVSWSILGNPSYASIDAETGVVNVDKGLENVSITVKAEMIGNSSKIATKIISIDNFVEPESITIEGPSAISSSGQYVANFLPSDCDDKSVTWSIETSIESIYTTIDPDTGLLTIP